MNTTQLSCFLSVADFLNFSRAAKQLRMTQPAVSHQINSLEDELGVKLFARTSKYVRLTQEGYLFRQYAQQILSLTMISQKRLQESRHTYVIRFGIGCHSSLELQFLKPVLQALHREFPSLRPAIRLVPFPSLENLLEEGEIHVVMTFREQAPKWAAYRELALREAVCLCPKDHPFASCPSLPASRLKQGGCFAILPPHGGPLALQEIQNQLITGSSSDQFCFCDNLESVYALVESGFACAVLAGVPGVLPSGIRAVPIEGIKPMSYGAAFRQGDSNPALRAFLQQASLPEKF